MHRASCMPVTSVPCAVGSMESRFHHIPWLASYRKASQCTWIDANCFGDTPPPLTYVERIQELLRMLSMFTMVIAEMNIVSINTSVIAAVDTGQHQW